ncbi:hypothetical protein KKF55_05890 [Patescibacteria group bacterium]|nr:hypothetical protein [Patescibacteria group bacterium]
MDNFESSSVQYYVAKAGSNSIVDGMHINEQVQYNIAREIIERRLQGKWTALFSSGAVVLGKAEFNERGFLDKNAAKRLYSTIGQKKLMRSWEDAFIHAGKDLGTDKRIHTSEGILTRRDFKEDDAIANLQAVMREAIHLESTGHDLIFFVENGNDLIAKDPILNDNDRLASDFASAISAKALFLLSNVDGLFTGNPKHSDSRLVTEVDIDTCIAIENSREFAYIDQYKSKDGTGGFDTKLRAVHSYLEAVPDGIAYIGNGTKEKILLLLESGDEGTRLVSSHQ